MFLKKPSWESCSRKMWVISIVTLLLVLSPFLLLLFTSLTLIRHLLTLYKGKFHPELGPFFNGLDSILAKASPYTGDPVTNICFYTVLDGVLGLDELRQVIQKGLDKMELELKVGKSENGGRGGGGRGMATRGFRLKQYLTEWAGFICTADEPQFIKIEDHVRMLDLKELSELWKRQCPQNAQSLFLNSKLVEVLQEDKEKGQTSNSNSNSDMKNRLWNEEQLAQLAYELLLVPFKEKTSPWDALLLHNNKPPLKSNSNSQGTSVIMFRIHHSFTDGISLFSFFSHFLDQGQDFAYGKIVNTFSTNSQNQNQSQESGGGGFSNSVRQRVGTIFNNCVEAPEFISQMYKSLDYNIWRPSSISKAWRQANSKGCGYPIPFEFPLDRIRDIKGRYSPKRGDERERRDLQKDQGKKKMGPDSNPNPADGTTPMSMTTQTIILTAVSLGIRDYMIRSKIPRKDIPPFIHVNTAVAQRRARNEITNRFVFMPVRIPIGSDSDSTLDPDPQKVMDRIQKEYLAVKNSSFIRVCSALYHLLGLLPTFVPLGSSCIFTTGTCSNNALYEKPVSIRGIPVLSTQAIPSVPISDSFVVLSFSYHDRMKMIFGIRDDIVSSRQEARNLVKCIEKQLVRDL